MKNIDIPVLPGSPEAPVATAFTLAFLSQLLQQCISSIEQDMTNKKAQSINSQPKLTNGKRNDDSINNKHEQLEKVRKIKKSIKMRRRRRKRRDLSNSLDSCSLSDSDTIEIDSGDESDLSEGGLDGLDSDGEDSDDVYVESESDEESGLFCKQSKKESSKEACNGNGNSLTEAGKLLTQQILKDNLASKNGVAFGKVTQFDASDVSDVETGKFNLCLFDLFSLYFSFNLFPINLSTSQHV